MTRNSKLAIALLSIALVAAIGAAFYLFQQGQDYYLQLNLTRLDPLGLNTYASAKEQAHQPIIVFFGDSRAANWIAPEIKGATIVNRGIGAQTTAQVLGRFQHDLAPLKPKIVVLQVGINDLKTIPLFPEQKDAIIRICKGNIRQIAELSQRIGARVVITTIFPLGVLPLERRLFWSDDVAAAITEVNAYLEALAGDQVVILDSGKILANSQGVVDPKYSQDFLHLNSEGYAALNQGIVGLLGP